MKYSVQYENICSNNSSFTPGFGEFNKRFRSFDSAMKFIVEESDNIMNSRLQEIKEGKGYRDLDMESGEAFIKFDNGDSYFLYIEEE